MQDLEGQSFFYFYSRVLRKNRRKKKGKKRVKPTSGVDSDNKPKH